MDELQEYRDALIKLDELSLMLGRTLSNMRIGWDENEAQTSAVLQPVNDIARQISYAIPASIRATRPILPEEHQRAGRWMQTPIKLV